MSGYPDSGALIAAALIVGLLGFLFAIAFYVVSAIFLMRIFEKAGVQGKWRAWVPVYNFMVFSKLGDVTPWWVLIGIGASIVLSWVDVLGWILSLLTLAITAVAAWRVGLKSGGKDWYYLLLWLIPGLGTLIWLGIIAFDKAPWNPNIGPSPWVNSVLADKTVWAGVPVQPGAPAGAAPAAGAYAPPAPGGYAPPPAPGAYPPPPAAGGVPPVAPGYAAPAADGYPVPGAPQPPVPPPAAPEPPAAPPAAPEPPVTPEPPAAAEPPAGDEPPRV